MTTFEYLAGANTLILSLAVIRVVAGIPHALAPRRLYLVHLSWLSLGIMLCLVAFWAFLSYQEVEWTLPRFIAVIASSALLYTYCSIVVPSDSSTVECWSDYFFSVRIPLFATAALFMGVGLLTNHFLLGVPLFHVVNSSAYAALAIFAIGLSSAKHELHTVLALCPPLMFVVTVLLLARPNSLSGVAP